MPWFSKTDSATTVSFHSQRMYVITKMLLKMYPCLRHNILEFCHWTCYYPVGSLQMWSSVESIPDFYQIIQKVKSKQFEGTQIAMIPVQVLMIPTLYIQWRFHFEHSCRSPLQLCLILNECHSSNESVINRNETLNPWTWQVSSMETFTLRFQITNTTLQKTVWGATSPNFLAPKNIYT